MPPLIEKVDEYSLSPIQKFYSGASVFITGGTGFLGRLLIEKLLRSCPEIVNVYLLVRNKKDKGIHARLEELFDGPVFDRLKDECPKFQHKVVGISGDCGLPDLGINEQDRKLLKNEVSIVFHVAATVRFDEKLKLAVAINVRGTQDLLKLCKEMPHLKSVVHVSTAFSNCAENVIQEVFYPPPIESKKLIVLSEALGDQIQDEVTSKLLGNFPNTYAFTKAVAEHMVLEEGRNLPVAVYRPSIVVSTYKEPIGGWINNLYGPTGVTAGAAGGVIRSLHCDSEVNANIIPADMCVNGLIAIPWEVDEKFNKCKRDGEAYDIPIYNYESGTDQPISWGRFMNLAEHFGMPHPSINVIWYYNFTLRKYFAWHFIAILFLHYLPALLVDTVLFCVGKTPRFLKIYKKIHRFSHVISYFCTKNFYFESIRMRSLISKMSPKDQIIFFCDLKKLDWEEFMKSYIIGIRLYLMKDPLSTLEPALRRFRKLYWCHQACKFLLYFVAFRLSWVALTYAYALRLKF